MMCIVAYTPFGYLHNMYVNNRFLYNIFVKQDVKELVNKFNKICQENQVYIDVMGKILCRKGENKWFYLAEVGLGKFRFLKSVFKDLDFDANYYIRVYHFELSKE